MARGLTGQGRYSRDRGLNPHLHRTACPLPGLGAPPARRARAGATRLAGSRRVRWRPSLFGRHVPVEDVDEHLAFVVEQIGLVAEAVARLRCLSPPRKMTDA